MSPNFTVDKLGQVDGGGWLVQLDRANWNDDRVASANKLVWMCVLREGQGP